MAAEERGCPDLEGWPTHSLALHGVRQISLEEFRERVAGADRDAGTYSVQTAPGGTVSARVVGRADDNSDACQQFLRTYLAATSFSWEPEHLFLINEPCYIAVGSGVVFLADGKIVVETLFPTGNETIALRVGGGLTAENIGGELRRAPELGDGVWVPLLSRGSLVYGHAIAESMVQDSALDRAGLSHLISYAATAWPQGAQEIVMARAHAPVVRFPALLVKVPRVLFASKLYRHPPLGREFEKFIERAKVQILADAGSCEPPADKIYVSRLGVPNRRMSNEPELVECLSRIGFHIVSGERLSFEEQVRTFRNARLVVGAYGSGLVNGVFAGPHATLCELRPLNNPYYSPNWDDFYIALAATMQFSYGIFVADNPPGSDIWECDIPKALELITSLSADLDVQEGARRAARPQSESTPPTVPHDNTPKSGDFWTIGDLEGDDYYSLIVRLLADLRPRNFAQIGGIVGDILSHVDCPSIVVGPQFEINQQIIGQKPFCGIFQLDSHVFFSLYDPTKLFGENIEMALLSGSRLFENVIHEFTCIERHAKKHSVVVIYDCIPTDAHICRRFCDDQTLATQSTHPHWWTGDVWKAILILKTIRPDLHIHTFDAFPTGLAVITNLDPTSAALPENHPGIVEKYRALEVRSTKTFAELPSAIESLRIE